MAHALKILTVAIATLCLPALAAAAPRHPAKNHGLIWRARFHKHSATNAEGFVSGFHANNLGFFKRSPEAQFHW